MIWESREEKMTDIFSFEYHEKTRDRNKSPFCYNSTDTTHDRYTIWCNCSDLVREKCLDISCILFDNIESMIDIIRFEEYIDESLNIGVKMKSLNSFDTIDFLSGICPVDNQSCSICEIVDDDRYERSDHDASEKENDDIDTEDGNPCGDLMFFTTIHQRIDEYGKKSSNC